RTWRSPITVAKDPLHHFNEGAYVPLTDGTLVCVMRDNNRQNYPSQVVFSFDAGETWTEPAEAPFFGDRPFAGQLTDGRLLVTYRNVAGNAGTYAWLGEVTRDLGYRCAALHLGPE